MPVSAVRPSISRYPSGSNHRVRPCLLLKLGSDQAKQLKAIDKPHKNPLFYSLNASF
ncbi:hypothetical protein TRIP_B330246 [uncultured Desulfatiglans sp.]|uniref:Uncharacterized protein n=1 Tax=Uncultured Desulfatiglans sp. TaxID=1748965 RepID=A0A653A7N7_UNCDX|nr:hypothetical protein TRIP_B330246 [uncultured Desulfatiglans sp.]